jgi:hypothetical protein
MSSLRKTESSQANGARSHGPVTAEGKQRSSQNALRHGLLAEQVVLDCEGREAFEDLLTDHVQRFQPADEVAYAFVEEMAVCHWRIRRTWAIEARMLQDHVDDQLEGDGIGRITRAFHMQADSPTLAVIHRYETRLHGMYQRALKNLLLLRTLELPKEPNPISEHPDPTPDPPTPPAPPADRALPNEPNPISEHSDLARGPLPPASPEREIIRSWG